MTKKDYIRIAAAMFRSKADLQAYADSGKTPEAIHSFLVYSLCDALAEDNPRFDRVRFAIACGFASA